MNCQNCGAEYNGNFCPKCGRPTQTKSPTYYTGQIVSMFLVIASLFGMVISVGPVSSVLLMNGVISVQEAIITNPLALSEFIPNHDMNKIALFLIPIFYISLVLLITASIFSVLKRITVKNVLASLSLIITVVIMMFANIANNVVGAGSVTTFIILNVGLLIFMLLLLIESNQRIWNSCWAIALPIIFVGNLIPLIAHLRIPYDNINAFMKISILNVFMLLLWCIPCIVNLVTLFRLKGNERRWGAT